MHNLGFNTWYSRVCELAKQTNIDVECKYTKREIKLAVAETFKMERNSILSNVTLSNVPYCGQTEILNLIFVWSHTSIGDEL